MLDTAKDLANFLNVSLAKVRRDTRFTDMPRVKMNRSIRYEREAVLAYLRAKNEIQTAAKN